MNHLISEQVSIDCSDLAEHFTHKSHRQGSLEPVRGWQRKLLHLFTMTPNMLTLTNILLVLSACHLALAKDPEDDSIRFPSDIEIAMRRLSPEYHHYHHEEFDPELRNPSNKPPIEPAYHIDGEDEEDEQNEVGKN